MKKYPFKFLDSYKQDDTDIFFGRDEEIAALYEMIFQTSILLIYGASGTGKTSLIQCGLAGKFKSYDWLPITVRRGNNINASLEKQLTDAGGNEIDDDDLIPKDPSKKLTGLGRLIKGVYMNNYKPIYLIFDQFEELYVLGTKDEQKIFIESVKEILKVEQPLKMIFSIREEYLGYLYDFEKEVPQLLRKKMRIEPMTLDKVTDVLKGINNYKLSNVKIKEDQLDAITQEIFERIKGKKKTLTIQLPYLQVFLDKLYIETTGDESRQADAIITMDVLNRVGDIGDVLRNFLEEQVKKISEKLSTPNNLVSAETIWKILSPFCTLEGTKVPISKKDLAERLPHLDATLINAAVDNFVNSRIVIFSENENLYELAHDSLALRIAEKRSDEDIAILEVQRLIDSQVSVKPEAREFFSEKQLLFIEPYLDKFKISDEEQDWLNKSRTKVKELKGRIKARRMGMLLISFFILVLISAFLFKLYKDGQKKHEQVQLSLERDKANFTNLMVSRQNAIGNENYLQALFFTIEALQLTKDKGTSDSLLKDSNKKQLFPTYVLKKYLLCSDEVDMAMPQPGYKTIYTWTEDSAISEIDLETGALLRSARYQPRDGEKLKNFVIKTTIKTFSTPGSASLETKNTVLLDSSLYFLRNYLNLDIFERDSFGYTILPRVIKRLYGASLSQDRMKYLTWGQNTESIFDAVNIWTNEGMTDSKLSLIHDGIKGAVLSKDGNLVFTWGTDSSVRVWQKTNATLDTNLSPKLLKLKIQLETGVEMDASHNIETIPSKEYFKLKEEFTKEEKKYKSNSVNRKND